MSTIRLPDGFLDELRARLRPSDVIGRKVKLKRQGKEWVGLSPFTNEKTPSFYVNDQKRIFKCFSSGIGGDIITFMQETERLSFMEAVEALAERAGMALPQATPQEREAYNRNQRLRAICEAAAVFFEDRLRASEGAQARQYLQTRGLAPAVWGRYRLGFAPDDWRKTYVHLKAEGFSEREIIDAGLAVHKEGSREPYDRFRGRLMFPIEDPQGHVIAFGGRALTAEAKPKYLNSSDTPLFNKSHILYHYKAARENLGHGEGGGLIVCEGYMDVIALAEAGFANAVAPLGTALTEAQLRLLWNAGPDPLLCFDGDQAGLRAAHRAIDRALPHLEPGRSLFFALLPDGLDPDDLIKARGRETMADILSAALPLVEVLWRRERDRDPIDTPERKAGLEERLRVAAGAIRHGGVKTAYERDLRQRMGDHFWDMRRTLRGTDKSMSRASSSPAFQAPAKVRGLGLLIQAIEAPALLEAGGEELAAVEFDDIDVGLIRDTLFDIIDSGKSLDRVAVRHHLERLGKARAVELLDTYSIAAPIDPDGAKAREWLVALEQFAALSDLDLIEDTPSKEAGVTSHEGQQRLLKKIAERRALRARVNEAAEETDRT